MNYGLRRQAPDRSPDSVRPYSLRHLKRQSFEPVRRRADEGLGMTGASNVVAAHPCVFIATVSTSEIPEVKRNVQNLCWESGLGVRFGGLPGADNRNSVRLDPASGGRAPGAITASRPVVRGSACRSGCPPHRSRRSARSGIPDRRRGDAHLHTSAGCGSGFIYSQARHRIGGGCESAARSGSTHLSDVRAR